MSHLHHVSRQPLPPVCVKVAEAASHTRHRHPVVDSQRHHAPPAGIPLSQLLAKGRVHQQVGQGCVTLVGLLDAVQETSTDDAATLRGCVGGGGAVGEGGGKMSAEGRQAQAQIGWCANRQAGGIYGQGNLDWGRAGGGGGGGEGGEVGEGGSQQGRQPHAYIKVSLCRRQAGRWYVWAHKAMHCNK